MQAYWTSLEPQFPPRGFSLLELNFDDRTCACNSLSLYGFTSGNNFAKLLHDTYVFSETVDASALKLNCLRVSM
ncbi:hypothetical protein D8674_014222 [Pyrus ussuriensis x Pyrus communis]|uniref:Uncharacterized protein n=1 Tax=Pyrus ussuriensis x Pyrus communis TaxID=2448454 RepID=A0A5N5GUN3_9ROSA|nr:hypothetical protein D8674_014222 [Pyrus ussuriensis x Pyrus communis]